MLMEGKGEIKKIILVNPQIVHYLHNFHMGRIHNKTTTV